MIAPMQKHAFTLFLPRDHARAQHCIRLDLHRTGTSTRPSGASPYSVYTLDCLDGRAGQPHWPLDARWSAPVADVCLWCGQVKLTFVPRPQVYDEFFALMLAFKDGSIDRHTVIQRVQHLLQDHDFLLRVSPPPPSSLGSSVLFVPTHPTPLTLDAVLPAHRASASL